MRPIFSNMPMRKIRKSRTNGRTGRKVFVLPGRPFMKGMGSGISVSAWAACLGMCMMLIAGCQGNRSESYIDEDELGIIDASVRSEDTHLSEKAEYGNLQPGQAGTLERSFENAPPLIPHTTSGFFPIKKENNICLSCHMPEMTEQSGAIAIPATHFTSLRPQMVEVDGVLQFVEEDKVHIQDMNKLNHAYFNCSQCHVPQAEVTVDIENLFSPEFREEFGLERSSLREKLREGVE